jgi:hypothetical protein
MTAAAHSQRQAVAPKKLSTGTIHAASPDSVGRRRRHEHDCAGQGGLLGLLEAIFGRRGPNHEEAAESIFTNVLVAPFRSGNAGTIDALTKLQVSPIDADRVAETSFYQCAFVFDFVLHNRGSDHRGIQKTRAAFSRRLHGMLAKDPRFSLRRFQERSILYAAATGSPTDIGKLFSEGVGAGMNIGVIHLGAQLYLNAAKAISGMLDECVKNGWV